MFDIIQLNADQLKISVSFIWIFIYYLRPTMHGYMLAIISITTIFANKKGLFRQSFFMNCEI